jgi:hypothetical protein
MRTCSECKYYEAINGVGRCKIGKPSVTSTNPPKSVWPIVNNDDKACGEYVQEPPA